MSTINALDPAPSSPQDLAPIQESSSSEPVVETSPEASQETQVQEPVETTQTPQEDVQPSTEHADEPVEEVAGFVVGDPGAETFVPQAAIDEGVTVTTVTDLEYIGRGDALFNVPARNLSAEEIRNLPLRSADTEEVYAWLISTGLYQAPLTSPESE